MSLVYLFRNRKRRIGITDRLGVKSHYINYYGVEEDEYTRSKGRNKKNGGSLS